MSASNGLEPLDDRMRRSLEMERLVLGSVLLAPDNAAEALAALRHSDFLDYEAQRVARAISRFVESGQDPNAQAIATDLDVSAAFVLRCVRETTTSANFDLYLSRLVDDLRLRQVGNLATIIAQIHSRSLDGAQAAVEVEAAWGTYCAQLTEDDGYVHFGELLSRVMEQTGTERRIPAPIISVDDCADGFPVEGLIVIAGRPGMGKSSFLTSTVTELCATSPGDPGIIFSMEMSKSDVVTAIVAAKSGVDLARMPIRARGNLDLTDDEYGRISIAQTKLAKLPIEICDDPKQTVGSMSIETIRLLRRHKAERPAFIAIDHLGLIASSWKKASLYERTSELSREAKILSRRFKCPVFLLAQLNRQVEQRDPKRPRLADLRDSGSIEQDADVVLLLFRPSYYDEETEDSDEIIVAKNRSGPTGTAYATFTPRSVRWQ